MNKFDNSIRIDATITTDDPKFTTAAAALETELGLSGNKKNIRNQSLAFLIASTRQQKFAPNGYIAFGRSPDFYSKLEPNPAGLSTKFVSLIDRADELGLVSHIAGFRDPNGGSRIARFAPKRGMIDRYIKAYGLIDAQYEKHVTPIEVRTTTKRLSANVPKKELKALTSEIESYNEFIGKQRITVTDGGGKPTRIAYYDDCSVYRVFNRRSLDFGGRLYGAFWINLPKVADAKGAPSRAGIEINGEKTIELDLKGQHIWLLYALTGKSYPAKDDPYEVGNYFCQTVKSAFLSAINAKSIEQAWRATTKKLRADHPVDYEIVADGITTKNGFEELIRQIGQAHPDIVGYLGTDIGIKLQRVDSDIAVNVITRLAKAGIPALPVHDSFIVQRSKEAALREAIGLAYQDQGEPYSRGLPPIVRAVAPSKVN